MPTTNSDHNDFSVSVTSATAAILVDIYERQKSGENPQKKHGLGRSVGLFICCMARVFEVRTLTCPGQIAQLALLFQMFS